MSDQDLSSESVAQAVRMNMLSNQVLAAYVKTAEHALYAQVHFPVPPIDPNRPKPSRWQKWKWRMRRRWKRLTSYRLVSMQDYRQDYW